jgi:transcriptional regulator with XRE-family HTH domain
MTIGERLAILLKDKGISQKAFSKKIDYREQSISNLITGITKSPRADLVMEVARLFPDVNLRWLLLEEGEMFVNEDSASEQIIDELQKENSKLKDKIIELLEK